MQGAFVGISDGLRRGGTARRRIGARLVRHAEERIFRESRTSSSACRPSIRRRRLYERLGLHPSGGFFDDYIVGGTLELLFRKTIGPIGAFRPAGDGQARVGHAAGRGGLCRRGRGAGSAASDPLAPARLWDGEHVDLPLAPLVTHREVEARLRAVRDARPTFFALEEIGRSVEGRAIYHLAFGRGPFSVLLWSQIARRRTVATSPLRPLEYVRRHRTEPAVARVLGALQVHVVPCQPDGAERFQRRNAQGLDINRDALLLQTPEGRALKALRDRLHADVGFNLHNQSWRTSVGHPLGRRQSPCSPSPTTPRARRTQAVASPSRSAPVIVTRSIRWLPARWTLRRRVRGAGLRRQRDAVVALRRADRDGTAGPSPSPTGRRCGSTSWPS